jgi:aryl-phospho-beta-D-glucosidase BglC (GH1 family)
MRFFLYLFLVSLTWSALTPLEANGRLKLDGNHIVGEHGQKVQLRGWSSHGIHWLSRCYENQAQKDSLFKSLSTHWKADVFRIAVYVSENGYMDTPWEFGKYMDQAWFEKEIDEFVQTAERYGIYVIIDWHILNNPTDRDGNPNTYLAGARLFWTKMAQKYKDKKHVIYEIANEPSGGVNWSQVKSYADDIIPRIRQHDPHALIVVGTPDWSGKPGDALHNRVANPYNVLYSFHFYACGSGWHSDVQGIRSLSQSMPIFVTEWGITNPDGHGGYCPEKARDWLEMFAQNNISWAAWQFSDNLKNGQIEGTSALSQGSCGNAMRESHTAFNNKTNSGQFVYGYMSSADSWASNTTPYHTLPPHPDPVDPNKPKEPTGNKLIIEDFKNEFGDSPIQSRIGAASAIAKGDEVRFGGGFWKMMKSEENIITLGRDSLVIYEFNSQNMDQTHTDALYVRFDSKTAIANIPRLIVYLPLVGNVQPNDVDLSGLTAITFKARGAAQLRFSIYTQDMEQNLAAEGDSYGVLFQVTPAYRDYVYFPENFYPHVGTVARDQGKTLPNSLEKVRGISFDVIGKREGWMEISEIAFWGVEASRFSYDQKAEPELDVSILSFDNKPRSISSFFESEIVLDLGYTGVTKIQIVDLNGKIVYENSVSHLAEKYSLNDKNLKQLAPARYFVKLEHEGTYKFLTIQKQSSQ